MVVVMNKDTHKHYSFAVASTSGDILSSIKRKR